MLIVGTFEHSIELEQALGELEHCGIPRNKILAVPMDTHPDVSQQFTGKSDDFFSKGVEVGMASATACSVAGTSAGFALAWGPIVWGLAAASAGFIAGFGLYFLLNRNMHRHLPKKLPEITVIVQCPEDQSRHIMDILWQYRALTVGQARTPS